MEVSWESLMLLKSALESARSKINESFQHIHFSELSEGRGLYLLSDAVKYLIATEHLLEQSRFCGLDSELSKLTQDYLDFLDSKLPSNQEAS